jgi:hypothetical protein
MGTKGFAFRNLLTPIPANARSLRCGASQLALLVLGEFGGARRLKDYRIRAGIGKRWGVLLMGIIVL